MDNTQPEIIIKCKAKGSVTRKQCNECFSKKRHSAGMTKRAQCVCHNTNIGKLELCNVEFKKRKSLLR